MRCLYLGHLGFTTDYFWFQKFGVQRVYPPPKLPFGGRKPIQRSTTALWDKAEKLATVQLFATSWFPTKSVPILTSLKLIPQQQPTIYRSPAIKYLYILVRIILASKVHLSLRSLAIGQLSKCILRQSEFADSNSWIIMILLWYQSNTLNSQSNKN